MFLFLFCLVRCIFLCPFTYSSAQSRRPERGINHWFGWLHCARYIRPGRDLCVPRAESDPALLHRKKRAKISCVPLARLRVSCEAVQVADKQTCIGHITSFLSFYVLLTLHRSLALVNDQLDTQFFYFIIHLLQSSTCFEQRRAHH